MSMRFVSVTPHRVTERQCCLQTARPIQSNRYSCRHHAESEHVERPSTMRYLAMAIWARIGQNAMYTVWSPTHSVACATLALSMFLLCLPPDARATDSNPLQ